MEGFELVDGKFIARVVDEAALERTHVLGAIFGNGESAWRLLKAAQAHVFQSSSYITRSLNVANLRKVAIYFRAKGVVTMPATASDWQSAIVRIYEYHLRDQPGKATLRTRITQWQEGIKPLLEFLRDVGKIIPQTVKVPPKRRFRAKQQPNFNKGTIADGTIQKIGTAQDINETSALLLNFDISQTNAEYLENFRDRLITVRSALDADCVAYVQSMAAHFEYGERLLKMCTEAQANALKATYRAVKDSAYREMRRHLEKDNLPGATEISLARILRLFLMENRLGGVKKIFKSTWLPAWQCVNFPSDIPLPPFPEFNGPARRFRWMLGLIDVTDLCVLHMLLSLRNPSFNATGLFDAKLRDKRGNLNFTFVVNGKAFVVNKRRVPARKRSTLDGESILAINTMLQMTKRARELLPDSSPLKNRLFLINKYDGVCATRYGTLYNFADSESRTLKCLLPRTYATGIPAAHVIPKRIRRTNAVLEWFRTGSVLKAARLIGNSTKVVIKHYIPEALLQAWNVRLVRRYQNLLLATASAHEAYCLAATDFSTLAELKKFIDDMLNEHSPTSSKLAAIVHERFCHPEQFDAGDEQQSATKPGSLVVNISPKNLSVLYAFRDVAYEKGFQSLQSPTSKRGHISTEAVVDLADLLTTRLPDHHDTTIRSAHMEAERLAVALMHEIRSGAFATFEKQV